MQAKKKICESCKEEKFIWANIDGKGYCQYCYNKIKLSEPKEQEYTPHGYIKRTKPVFPKIVSTKRKIEQKEYSIERYLYLVDHSKCEANIKYICKGPSTEIHHMAGRVGTLYLNKDNWLAVCRDCHEWIENHPKEAKELGFSKSRLEIKLTLDEVRDIIKDEDVE